ncbi:lysophospholipid acyltransferase family protein [Prosthecochloris vibrioformis]|uniref:Lysophospholipid acyltransferase family protein n=1 Tax=Prosthecochloris vibrioformis TaxID=1098 RepID=A0A5C4RS12_PROVB|nr:lysophospholipid acyltransferase family protein [Prosthecochloris vibrioformis]TNJ34123.1 lysophospholipid acyltransferase family protein [Prosthecochloris vibrioformis]
MARRSRWKAYQDKLIYRLFTGLGRVVRLLSRKQFEWIAFRIGDFLYDIVRVRRGVVRQNLAAAFPDKELKERRRIGRQVYRNMSVSLLEILRIPMVENAEDANELIDIDLSEFIAATKEQGKGGILLSAHFGNWELAGVCIGLLGLPMTVVAKRLRNKLIDQEINRIRKIRGNDVLYKRQALRDGLRLLKNGGVLTILGDQSDPDMVFVTDFLGRPASFFQGPAFLALKAQVPVFLIMTRRQPGGKYLMELKEIKTSDLSFSKASIQELTLRYIAQLEHYIRTYPEEWFWLHNRWKRSV